eukprot:TRINITY_DN14014_c0_g1_i2.p1 TRINITY_DN14014_c0_g1~~TRINITY_DN14014_c0_g1_i2.p1  ORF type:complete len:327 (-),score=60.14 TRINITY_DN14014_c0_g1_i2:242-1222(-)
MSASASAVAASGAAALAGCFAGLLSASRLADSTYVTAHPTKSKRNRSRRAECHAEWSSAEDSTPRDCKYLAEASRRKDAQPQQEPMEAGWQGFSMAEARQLADTSHKAAAEKSPQDVLADLQKGNMRFWTGAARRPERSAFERRALLSKQFPLVAVLGCSDSRVPTEIVFDVGLGDLFVSRVAGNCLDTTTLASMLYAVHHLKVKVLIVLGHEACGAVKAAGLPSTAISKEPRALSTLLNGLKGGLEHARLQDIHDHRAYDREAVVTNVRRQIEQLAADDGIMLKVAAGELILVGAFYEISSGIVDFFSEVTVSTMPSPRATTTSK